MRKYLVILFFIYSIIFAPLIAHPDFIESFKIINKNKIIVKANKAFSKQFIKEDFFAEYDENIDLTKLDESIVTIPFILSIIPVVWFSNKIYSIDVMDKDLYHSLQKVKEVFRQFYPRYSWSGRLVPKQLITNRTNRVNESLKAVLLFSGGLDSVESSINYIDAKQLLFTTWGADVGLREGTKWQIILEQVQQFAKTYNHDQTFVKSNFRKFIEKKYLYSKFPRWWVRVSYGLSFVGMAAPLLVAYNIPKLLIASSLTAKHPYPCGSHPAVENNVSFAGKSVYHCGAEKNRMQKITSLASICKEKNIPLPKLRVCWSDSKGKNCIKCEKCLRTIFNIISVGQLPKEFGFNIEVSNAIQLLKRFFKNRKCLKGEEIWLWRNTWEQLIISLQQTKLNKIMSKEDRKALQEFLQSLNLARYETSHTSYRYFLQQHAFFLELWEKNVKEIAI